MSLIQHHAIIATTWDEEVFNQVCSKIEKEKLNDYFLFHRANVNGYCTILCPPDGSKEGWNESDEGDKRRKWFMELLKATHHWSIVYVTYGELDTSYLVFNEEE